MTVSGPGTFKLDVSWPFDAFGQNNLAVDLFLGASATGTPVATSNSSTYADPSEHINYTLPALSYPATQQYTVRVRRVGGTTGFTVQNTSRYPVAPSVGFALHRTSDNVVVASSTAGSGTPSRSLSAPSLPAGSYYLRTTTTDDAVTVTTTGSRPNRRFPNLKLELLKGTSPKTLVTSATGTLTFPSWFAAASEGGGWSWRLSNLSNASYTATPTLNWSAITRGVDVDTGALAAGQLVEKTVVPDAAGTLDTTVVWSTEPNGTTATLRLALKNAAGTELAFVTGSSGTLTLPSQQLVAATSYKVAVTNAAGPAVRSFTRTATLPSQGSHVLELVDADSVVKLRGTGRKPQTLSGSVAPGSYTLRVTPISGAGSVTTTASFPGRVPSEVTTFDGKDHAKTIDDGTTTVEDYLAPSGRVIRRVVRPSGGGTPTEETLFGYDDDGDAPAYSRPAAGGPVTTYLDGAIDVAGTITYQHFNLHGDVIGTSNSAGVFTAVTPADEYGLQEAQSTSRLGWLGKQRRFEVGVNNLIRMGVRLYDPRTGRFTSVDPIEGGSANDYDYVAGDPINQFDLDGRCSVGGIRIGFMSNKKGGCKGKGVAKGVRNQARKIYRHNFISTGICVKVCFELTFQHGHFYGGVGGAGLGLKGLAFGYTSVTPGRQKNLRAQTCAAIGVGGCAMGGERSGRIRSRRKSDDYSWWGYSVGFGVGGSAGGMYSRKLL